MFFCSGNFQLPRIFFSYSSLYLFGNDQEIWSDENIRSVKVEISPLVYDIESGVFTTVWRS